MAEYKYDMYHTGSFRGGSNDNISLITFEDNIFITLILRGDVSHWYHTNFHHTGMDITEAMIFQHLYCPRIRNSVRKEVTYCDTCQCTKLSNIKYGKLTAKETEVIP